MSLQDQILSATGQIAFALAVAGICFFIQRRTSSLKAFADYVGLQSPREQLDRVFAGLLVTSVIYGVASTYLEFNFSAAFHALLTSQNSPFASTLRGGFGAASVLKALIYSFLQSAGAEEIFFRGLIARRACGWLGPRVGNIVQALVFWLMHLAIFRLISGEWVSVLQAIVFVSSFGFGLVLGFANLRRGGASLWPSWILHGTTNFVVFLTLAAIS